MNNLTIADIKRKMKARGSHWWNKENMAFFGTKVITKVYNSPGSAYFVTLESSNLGSIRFPGETAFYVIRRYVKRTKQMESIGGYQNKMTKENAIKAAKYMAKKERVEDE